MTTTKANELAVPYVTPVETYAVSIILPFLGIVFVLLRFYVRSRQKWSIGIDDWMILSALAMIIGMGITLIIGVHHKAIAYPTPYVGNLSPEEELTSVNPTIKFMGIIQFVFIILMVLAFGILKLSITFYYRRIFVTARGSLFDWTTRVAIAISVMWTITFVFGTIFSCGRHVSANWGSVQDALVYCGVGTNFTSALVVSDLITDVMVLCLPLPVIWNLRLTTGQKWMVTGILATGAVSIVASIIKAILSFQITNAGFNTHVDPDLTVSTILYWSMIEGGLAVIAACLPTLRFLVGKISISSIVNSLRSVLSLDSVPTQRPQRSAALPIGPYTNIHADSSATSHTPIVIENDLGDGFETKGHGIHVARQLSQHASIV